jgi:hypothetical protein
MKYAPLEARSADAIERYLKREIRRMTDLVAAGKRKRSRCAAEQAFMGIMLGEKFAYQNLLFQMRKAGRRAR